MNDTLRHAWQSAGTDATLPDLAELRAGADTFYRKIRQRNAIEYAACLLVVLFFGAGVIFAPSVVAKLGMGLVALGAVIVAWQLHRRAAAVAVPAEGTMPILAHQRAQLVRQRDALAQVGWWYLGPFVPGLTLMMFAPAFERGPAALLGFAAADWIRIVICASVFGGVWLLNRHAAKALQRAIDDLDALAGDS